MRPLGATLVGFYQILRGVIGAVFGLSVLLFTGLIAKLTSLAAEGSALAQYIQSFGRAAGLVVIVFGIVHMVAGYGVLRMQNWGRLLTLLFSAVGLVLLLPGLLHGHIFSLLFGAINAACIVYLILPAVKNLFRAQGSSMRMAA